MRHKERFWAFAISYDALAVKNRESRAKSEERIESIIIIDVIIDKKNIVSESSDNELSKSDESDLIGGWRYSMRSKSWELVVSLA